MSRASLITDRTMRSVALVVTDRRWAATLSAMALGFGLFIGVAIGPGADGGFATPAPLIVQNPTSGGGTSEEGGGGAEVAAAPVPASPSGAGAVVAEAPLESSFPTSIPLSEPSAETAPVESAPPTEPSEPAAGDEPAAEAEPEPEGQVLEGVVVQANAAAGSYALAIKGGELVSVHSAKLPAAGAKLSLYGRQLANGTFAEEEKPTKDGRASKAGFTGTVTFADPDPLAPAYTVSGRGASVLVRVKPDPGGAIPELPPLGSFATVEVAIAKPVPEPAVVAEPLPEPPLCEAPEPAPEPPAPASALWQGKLEVEDVEPSTYLELSGVVSGVCADRPGILISADGAAEGDDDLLLIPSPGLDTKALEVGESVLATAEVGADGALSLTGIAGDERTKGADDPKTAQGDLAR